MLDYSGLSISPNPSPHVPGRIRNIGGVHSERQSPVNRRIDMIGIPVIRLPNLSRSKWKKRGKVYIYIYI